MARNAHGNVIENFLGTALASATTTPLWGSNGETVHITGTTAITSFGPANQSGSVRRVIFDAILTLTHSANLLLPGSADIITAAGDVAIVVADGLDIARVVSYMTAASTANAGAYPINFRSGGEMVRTGGDADAIDVTAGGWRDGGDTDNITFTAFAAKQLDAVWAAGDTAGMLDTGAIAADTFYFIWVIKNPATGVVDILASLSSTAPTMPTGYTLKRRIGIIRTDATPDILPFVQNRNRFQRGAPIVSFTQDNDPGTTAVLRVLNGIPLGYRVRPILSFTLEAAEGATVAVAQILITDPALTDTVPTSTKFTAMLMSGDATAGANSVSFLWDQGFCDTSGRVRTRQDVSNADMDFNCVTHGWIDDLLDEGL